MPRARWFVLGFAAVVLLVGGVLNARGPFAPHPGLGYAQFLADVEAGRVEQIREWQDQLEVTVDGQLRTVVVPPEADFTADLALAHVGVGVGLAYAHIPDAWLGLDTPWVPVLILLAGATLWATAIARNRRATAAVDTRGSG